MENIKVQYFIVCNYVTGNSFDTEEASEMIEIPFTDIQIVAENLKRLKEHLSFYNLLNDSLERYHSNLTDDELREEWKRKDWAIIHKRGDGTESIEEYSCKLLLENGKEFIMSTPWVGYFEKEQNFSIKTVIVN